ncbi:undecaprenyldiphospho-muramoylpentapeptide beta-N-acetylglucosaminyltransferase [soil metagenome]
MTRVLFATGGTGGHIYPALSVAKEAQVRGYQPIFLGGADSMEARVIPEAGFEFHGVATGKWDRSRPDPRQGFKAVKGLAQAVQWVRRLEPAVVIGFGGFASFPGLAAARILGVPYVLHEGNAYPGKVTRWLAGGAAAVAVSQQAAAAHLPQANKIVVTGFPVREERVDKAEARARLNLPATGPLTFVMGGSQGSVVLNEAVPAAFGELAAPGFVLHSVGRRWETQVEERTRDLETYHTTGFVDATLAWSAADLAITRAGISTLSEAAFHGVPVIMVPLPSSAENHQLHNAQSVAAAGAGWVVEEKNLAELRATWQHALEPEVLEQASRAPRVLSPRVAAGALVDLLDTVLCSTHPANPQPQESL